MKIGAIKLVADWALLVRTRNGFEIIISLDNLQGGGGESDIPEMGTLNKF